MSNMTAPGCCARHFTSLPCSDLETEAQAEFDLSRVAYLTVDQTESRGGINVHCRVAGLEMVQHVGELRAECHAHPFVELDIFCDAEVEVPPRQASYRHGGPAVGIEPQDQTPELRVDLIRIGKHVYARSLVRRVGVQAYRPVQHEILMGGVAARVGLRQHCVLPTCSRAAVHLAERLAVGAEVYAQRQPALDGEERRD